jgi:hypothetical protein
VLSRKTDQLCTVVEINLFPPVKFNDSPLAERFNISFKAHWYKNTRFFGQRTDTAYIKVIIMVMGNKHIHPIGEFIEFFSLDPDG